MKMVLLLNKLQIINSMNKHELEKEVEWLQICNQEMQVLIDILWEYIWEKDYEEINKRLEEHENTMEQTQTRV